MAKVAVGIGTLLALVLLCGCHLTLQVRTPAPIVFMPAPQASEDDPPPPDGVPPELAPPKDDMKNPGSELNYDGKKLLLNASTVVGYIPHKLF